MHFSTRFFVEVDNHTMTSRQMRRKWERMGTVKGFVLVICHSKARMRNLIRGATPDVKNVALFSRFAFWIFSP